MGNIARPVRTIVPTGGLWITPKTAKRGRRLKQTRLTPVQWIKNLLCRNFCGRRLYYDQMRHEFAPEAMMHIHRVEEERDRLRPREAEDRLPIWQSVGVIAGLSVLSWGVLIAIVV